MLTEAPKTAFIDARLGRGARLGLIATALLTITSPAAAQLNLTSPSLTSTTACTPQFVDVRIIEWDINALGDAVSGALAVDDRSSSRKSKVWFATRVGDPTRLYRLTPGHSIKKDAAQARSWPLGAIQTGGLRLRPSDDGRLAFVNTNGDGTNAALVAVDTADDTRTTWFDRPVSPNFQMSDVSIDTRDRKYSVFTAAPTYTPNDFMPSDFADGQEGVVQQLRPLDPVWKDGKLIVPADATRYPVGGGAGTCQEDVGGGGAAPCIPGVVVDRRRGHPIYFSAPDFVNQDDSIGAIGEIDPSRVKCNIYDFNNSCVKVRYWPVPNVTLPMDPMPVSGPRQILVDDSGRVWGITDSGHLFALEINGRRDKGLISLHNPDGPGPEYLFAVAPDGGTIGFTDSDNNEASVLVPDRFKREIRPAVRLVKPVTRRLNGIREAAPSVDNAVITDNVTAVGQKYTKDNDGTYLETNVGTGTATSLAPTGMAPDGARRTGSFFFGATEGNVAGANRIGHLEGRVEPDREVEDRKDDDDFDDDGDDDNVDNDDDDDGRTDDWDDDDDNDCIPDHMDEDHDNDGVENEHDTKSNRENKRTDRGSMAPGEAKEYEMTSTSNSLAMVAIVEAATLTTPLSIQIVDPNGVVVLSTPPLLGKAVATATPALPGVYTIRVKNGGLSSTTYKTTLLNKSIWF